MAKLRLNEAVRGSIARRVVTLEDEFHRSGPDKNRVYERWTLARDPYGHPTIKHERLIAQATLKGEPALVSTTVIDVGEFLLGDYDPKAKNRFVERFRSGPDRHR
jgi:hypothetical protein